jgi:hypothetical protein
LRVQIAAKCVLALLVLVCLAVNLIGCTAYLRRKELEAVAKDWSMSIRASQVIPVYPLTEDVQPGDVFLVQTPVQSQADLYSERGFLPLDQLVTRLSEMRFREFYKDAYWLGDYATTPHTRPRPRIEAEPDAAAQGESPAAKKPTPGRPESPVPGADAAPGTPTAASNAGRQTAERSRGTRFPDAEVPRVAFPSYDFIVESGAGAKVAVPVQGVPVGLALMGTSSATGSITLSDAFTYGTDGETLLRRLNEWAVWDVRQELGRIARSTKTPLYLRVVSRVYLVGAVVVSLQNQAARSAGVDAGAAQNVPLVDLRNSQTDELKTVASSYREALSALSSALNAGLPGGSIRLASATRGSVILHEDFDRPLVLGYLGFDVPVRADGSLGPPVATKDVLEGRDIVPDLGPSGSELRSLSLSHLRVTYSLLRELQAEGSNTSVKARAADLVTKLDALATVAPAVYPVTVYQREASNLGVFVAKDTPLRSSGFPRITTYLAKLNESIREIDAVLARPDGTLEGQAMDGEARKRLGTVRKETATELERVTTQLRLSPAVAEAMTFAGTAF